MSTCTHTVQTQPTMVLTVISLKISSITIATYILALYLGASLSLVHNPKQLVAGVVVKVVHERHLDVVYKQLLANAIPYNPFSCMKLNHSL